MAHGVSRQTLLHRVKRGELRAVHVRTGRTKGLRIEPQPPQKDCFDHDNQSKEQCDDAPNVAASSGGGAHLRSHPMDTTSSERRELTHTYLRTARVDVRCSACLGNVGPAFGAAGPFGSYAGFGGLFTAVLTTLMWLGRA